MGGGGGSRRTALKIEFIRIYLLGLHFSFLVTRLLFRIIIFKLDLVDSMLNYGTETVVEMFSGARLGIEKSALNIKVVVSEINSVDQCRVIVYLFCIYTRCSFENLTIPLNSLSLVVIHIICYISLKDNFFTKSFIK